MKKTLEQFLPPATMDVHPQHLQEFFITMYKRQEIWWRRWLGWPHPWSDDPILNNYRFCNVYRELDRSSQYLIQNVYLKHNDLTHIVFCILAHRIYNKPETFERIGYPDIHKWDCDAWIAKLFKLEKNGFHTLNQEAYKINTYKWGGEPRWYAYTKHILDVFAERINTIVRLVTTGSAEQVVKELRKVVGSFLTHEYYQDFCDLNTYRFAGTTKFDKNTWTSAGPGAKGGLRLIFPSLPEERSTEGIDWLKELASEWLSPAKLPTHFKFLSWNSDEKRYYVSEFGQVNRHMVEMWLCEYLKYRKVDWKVGKQRQRFIPSTVS